MKYVSKHKFFVSTITSCFLNKLCSSNVLSIGIFFADTRWCSEVFPHPNSVFKVYHPLYSVLVLSLQKQPLSSHEPSLHGTEIGMWSLVSQKEKPNEKSLTQTCCLEILPRNYQNHRQAEASRGSQLLRSSISFEIIWIRNIQTSTAFLPMSKPHLVQKSSISSKVKWV